MSVTKAQRFTVERRARSSIQNAPYNPRTIDPVARKKLERNLRKVGLLAPLIVNKRTGNLVGGHQRLACIDAIEGSEDYEIDVSIVDMSPKVERQQNVFLNNRGAQGDWDYPLLEAMLTGDDFSVEDSGFDNLELDVMFGRDLFEVPEAVGAVMADVEALIPAPAPKVPVVGSPPAATRDDSPEAMKARRNEARGKIDSREDAETYIVIVCGTREECSALAVAFGRPPSDKYIDGNRVFEKLGVEAPSSTVAG